MCEAGAPEKASARLPDLDINPSLPLVKKKQRRVFLCQKERCKDCKKIGGMGGGTEAIYSLEAGAGNGPTDYLSVPYRAFISPPSR